MRNRVFPDPLPTVFDFISSCFCNPDMYIELSFDDCVFFGLPDSRSVRLYLDCPVSSFWWHGLDGNRVVLGIDGPYYIYKRRDLNDMSNGGDDDGKQLYQDDLP